MKHVPEDIWEALGIMLKCLGAALIVLAVGAVIMGLIYGFSKWGNRAQQLCAQNKGAWVEQQTPWNEPTNFYCSYNGKADKAN